MTHRVPTHEDADKVVAALEGHFHGTVVSKDDVIKAAAIAAPPVGLVLAALNKLAGDVGMTLGPLVLIPDRWNPRSTIVGVAHEFTHVLQARQLGFKLIPTELSGEGRARMEAHAYACGAEVAFALDGEVPTLDSLAGHLTGGVYLLDGAEERLARGLIEQRLAAIAAGTPAQSPVAIWLIDWLRSNIRDILLHP